MIWTLVASFLTYFYTDVAGIAAGAVGTLMLFVRLWDGVSDIGMGILVDRTNSKHGKARPYLIWMPIPLAITTVFLFTVPDVGMTGKITYAAITYSLFILLYTAVSIPFKTLLGMMTQEQHTRSMIGIVGAFFIQSSALLVNMITEPMASGIGGQLGWVMTGTLFGVLAVVTLYITFRTTKERVGFVPTAKQEEKVKLSSGVKALFKNKYWMIITLFCISYYTLLGFVGAELYFAKYILGNASYFSIISLVKAVPGILAIFFMAPIVKKIGKRNMVLIGILSIILSTFIKYLDPTSLNYFLIGSAFNGFGKGIFGAMLYALINDTVEYGEWKSKVRTGGLVNSAASFGMKVGTGLGTAIVGWLLAFGGYVGNLSQQSDTALQMILYLNIHIPFLIAIIMFLLMWLYKLDKIYPQIVEELQQRKNE